MDLSTIRHREPIESPDAPPAGPRFDAQIFGYRSLFHSPGVHNTNDRLAASMAFNILGRLCDRWRASRGR